MNNHFGPSPLPSLLQIIHSNNEARKYNFLLMVNRTMERKRNQEIRNEGTLICTTNVNYKPIGVTMKDLEHLHTLNEIYEEMKKIFLIPNKK